MVNNIYDSTTKYFNHLSNVGYMNNNNTNKLLVYNFLNYMLDNDFRGYISKEDYEVFNKALYCLYGSGCLIPYPNYLKNKNRRIMYKGSISELAYRVTNLEEQVKEVEELTEDLNDLKTQIEDTTILVPGE